MRGSLKWGQSPRWRVVSFLGLLAIWVGGPGVPWAAAGEAKEEALFRQIPPVQDTLKDADPFFRDTDLNVRLRTYYFGYQTTTPGKSQEGWAAGGWLEYKSGWLMDTLQIGTTLFGSGAIYSPENRTGTKLLKAVPDADGIPDFPIVYADDDTRDPSRFAMVYETGDNASVSLGGEATPLDLMYAQGVKWGDNYTGFPHAWNTAIEDLLDATPLYVMPQFDALESNADLLSGEASVEMTPSGKFMHGVWNQWQETLDGLIYNSDAWFRRVLFLDEIENPVASGGGGGDTDGGGGGKPPRGR